jgi:hypothetical protein
MDPAKVYGLARVLDRVAQRRQVIVFTHDDRLTTAIRLLGINAHLRVVSRRERSQVSVEADEYGDPALRYLSDANAVAKDQAVDAGLRATVVCTLVRQAIEARCHDVVLTREIRAGRPIADLENQLAQITRVREALALAVLQDLGRQAELDGALQRLHPRARRVVDLANRGTHPNPGTGQLSELIDDARMLVGRIVAR